jgi:hypothetical protein
MTPYDARVTMVPLRSLDSPQTGSDRTGVRIGIFSRELLLKEEATTPPRGATSFPGRARTSKSARGQCPLSPASGQGGWFPQVIVAGGARPMAVSACRSMGSRRPGQVAPGRVYLLSISALYGLTNCLFGAWIQSWGSGFPPLAGRPGTARSSSPGASPLPSL